MQPSVRALVVWFPDWPVAAAQTPEAAADDAGRLLAVVHHGKILACSPAARAEGVLRGMSVREAQSVCPQVSVLRHDPSSAARRFDTVLAALEEAAPGVHPIRPGLCAVPARGPARFYGGEDQAGRAVLAHLAEFGTQWPRVGIADGAFAAEQAARRSEPGAVRIIPPGREETAAFLASLPVGTVLPGDLAGLLRRLGVVTLGDLARLDIAAVRDRFGPAAAEAWGLAAGIAVATPRHPGRRDVSVTTDFEPPLDSAEQVAFAFRTAAESLLHNLGEAGLFCTAVQVEVQCESGEISERRWLHPRWFTAADVIDRVRWQLHSRDNTGPDSPVSRVTVQAVETVVAAYHQDGLWDSAPEERIHHGLSRVQGLLGHEAVTTGVLTGGRAPAERQEFVPWGDRAPAQAGASRQLPWPGALPEPAPARLFDPPRPARLLAGDGHTILVDDHGRLDAEPVRLAVTEHSPEPDLVTAWAGPWPVDERWWDGPRARHVYRVQAIDEAGRAWLLLLEGGRWSAEAQYD